MKTAINIFLGLFLISITSSLSAQPWMKDLTEQNPTFFEIRDAFYDYWKDRPIEKGQGYKQFKRWEWYWETRINADGSFPKSSVTWDAWNDYVDAHPPTESKMAAPANWSFIGPSTTPGGYNGLGRINCIAFHPTNANTFWVGTPAGGLWKTTNGGASWSTNTDNLPVLGVSDMAVDYVDPNIIYIATGDGDMGSLSGMSGGSSGDTKSIGILKSTDGGNTWNTTGMNWNVTSGKLIRRLVMNPVYPMELLAATSDGIYRTLDAGANWNLVQSGYFMDVEYKPNNSDTAYAATFENGNAKIFRTTNYGTSWSVVATLPSAMRINLAVTPAWPELVDALCANTSGGLAGLWYSGNSGASFSQYYSVPTCANNILNGCPPSSLGCGGQGHYDLAYEINPVNANEIWIGGVNSYRTLDGGTNWNIRNFWSSGSTECGSNPGVPTVHADKHFIAFHPLQPGTMFECNDGGLYKTTNGGTTWTDLSNGLQISQMYRLGVSQTISNNVLCGLQDNGTREIYNNTWYQPSAIGGDGMECLMDYSNPNIEYATYAYGKLTRTYDFWANTTVISNNIPGMVNYINTYGHESGSWVTPFVIHPTNPQTLFAGYHNVWKTTDRGDSWTQIGNLGLSTPLKSIAVAASNPNTIYAATYDTIFITTNGGANWNYLPLILPNAKISYITVDPSNAQRFYITISGYSAGNKVFMSPDAGVNWYNYSGSLPNVPANCIVYQNGTNEGLYVGTDLGVYYTDGSMNDWIPYQDGLPNVVVTELEISYNDNQLWAATYGRGLWRSDLSSSPVGIGDKEDEIALDGINIYPNPNNGNFSMSLPNHLAGSVTVYNSLGQQVWFQNTMGSNLVSVESLKEDSGIYLVVCELDGNRITKRMVLSK